MKKFILFLISFLIIMSGIVYFKHGKEILTLLDEKKVYSIENVQTTNFEMLNGFNFFDDGIVTYNNQKIVFLDYKGNVIWENHNESFSKRISITDKYILRNIENTIEVLDKNNQCFVINEIEGDILNVSRENDKLYILIKGVDGRDSLYVLNDKNEVVVDNKVFEDNITGVSISDKSEGYVIVTLRFEGDKIINTIHFNLLDEVELWSFPIEDEILVAVKIVNNNVVVIGTENIYYFNLNGKLLWKNGVYSRILDYYVDKQNEKIYMFYNNDGAGELMTYNFEGKVLAVNKVKANVQKLKICDNKVFVYNENSIYLIHGTRVDKLYENAENTISDFIVEDNEIRILSKDGLTTGKLK